MSILQGPHERYNRRGKEGKNKKKKEKDPSIDTALVHQNCPGFTLTLARKTRIPITLGAESFTQS